MKLTWRETGWYLGRFAIHWLLGGKFIVYNKSDEPGKIVFTLSRS